MQTTQCDQGFLSIVLIPVPDLGVMAAMAYAEAARRTLVAAICRNDAAFAAMKSYTTPISLAMLAVRRRQMEDAKNYYIQALERLPHD